MTPFFMAWGMFFAIPCPVKKWNANYFKEMLLCMPFIGLLIGLINTGVFFLCRTLFGDNRQSAVTAALLFLVPWILSGFIHLDGFMDCADAFLSRRELEERRRILKDSHVGAFAVIMLTVLSILSFAVCREADLENREWLLLFIPAVSRALSAFYVLILKALENSSYAGIHKEKIHPGYVTAAAAWFVCLTALAAVFCGAGSLILIIQAAVYSAVIFVLYRNLGGISGDISGSALTVCEFAAIAALLFIK